MFNESWPWKRDLASAADRLETARIELERSPDDPEQDEDEQEAEAVYQVERDVMFGAFAVRRLIGMPSKVTKQARATTSQVTRFRLRPGAAAPDIWDALGDLQMYDLSAPHEVTISANDLCNLFVHSLIFRLAWTVSDLPWQDYWALPSEDPRTEVAPTEFEGVLVASDTSSNNHVTLVQVPELVRVFRAFANDEATRVAARRDRRGRTHVTATRT